MSDFAQAVEFDAQAVGIFVNFDKKSTQKFSILPNPSAFPDLLHFFYAVSAGMGMMIPKVNHPSSAWTVTEPPYFSAVARMLFKP